MKIGTNTISSLKIGSTDISEVRIGSVLVWQNTDADAAAFIAASGITDATQKNAINQLVLDLKAASIWTKMKAIYPFVGGTASTHKFNLKDPRDLDAAYRLLFNGGWSHSINGALPNGTNGFANTFLNASSLTSDSNHFSFYSRTSSTTAVTVEIGAQKSSTLNFAHMRVGVNYLAGDLVITNFSTTTDARGLWIGSRTAINARETYRNGTTENTNTTSNSTALPNEIIFLSARSDDYSPVFYSDKECAFASIGDGLNSTEAANLYTSVQTFQTTLSRNV
jgi:hypothetical protein